MRIRAVMAAIVMASVGAAAFADVQVRAVRIKIDGLSYEWKDRGTMPAREEGGYTAPATVASFLGFAPGDAMAEPALEYAARAAEARLRECGWFYTASVMVLPGRSDPAARTVVVSVAEGFTWRFGGGSLFAMVGRDNAGGLGRSWLAIAGYNLDGLRYGDRLFLGQPLDLDLSAAYSNALGTDSVDYHRVQGDVSLGWRLRPDLSLGVESSLRWQSQTPTAAWAAGYPAGNAVDVRALAVVEGRSGLYTAPFDLRASIRAEGGVIAGLSADASPTAVASGAATVVASWPFLEMGAQVSVGWASAPLGYGWRYDLLTVADAAVRGPLAYADALRDRYVMANLELRGPYARFFLPPIFNVAVGPFLFADLAWAESVDGSGSVDMLEGYGGGIRLGFEAPVFVWFSFTYGWNRDGEGAFRIAASKGFQ